MLAVGVVDEGKVGVDLLGEADGPAVELIVLEPIISPDEEVSVDSVIGDVDCVDVAGLPVAVAQSHCDVGAVLWGQGVSVLDVLVPSPCVALGLVELFGGSMDVVV